MEDVFQIGIQFIDGKGIARMHRHGDHRLDCAQVDVNHAVIISDVGRIEFLIGIAASVLREESLRIVISPPYRGKTRRFRRHDVDAVAVVRRHGSDAGADEFHDFILDVAVLEDGADDGNSDVMGTDSRIRLARQIDADDAGISDVVSITEELLDQFAAAFAYSHGP